MTREKLAECLRHCASAQEYTDCQTCPFREEQEFPEDNIYTAECSARLMAMAAEYLEEDGE